MNRYTIKQIHYKQDNLSYARLCLRVRCDRTGEQFDVNGYSDVGVAFYKPKTCVRFNRAHLDAKNNLTKGLLEPVDVTPKTLMTVMKANHQETRVIKTVCDHFCWDTILSKATFPANVPADFDPDHWLQALATVYPCVRHVDADDRGPYCVNDEVVGLKRFLNEIGVYYSTHDIYNITNHMSFRNRDHFLRHLDAIVNVPGLTAKKINDLVNAIPPRLITPETRRMLLILVHIKEKQNLTGSIYVPLPPPVLWNDKLDHFRHIFYESEQKMCLSEQRSDEARFVHFIQNQLARKYSVVKDRSTTPLLLNEGQAQAVHNALHHRVSLVDGPPGSGKTFVTKAIITRLAQANVYFLAPTGKAVHRLKESVGDVGFFYTIHKLYYMSKRMKDREHEHWKSARFDAPSVFVVDEASMIGCTHMNFLLDIWTHIKPSVIVFLGDTHQLPPIDPGDPFRDLVLSTHVPRMTLTERFRQGNAPNALMDAILDVENHRVPNRYDESFQYVCLANHIVDKAHALLVARDDLYNDLRTGKVMVIASKNDTVNRLSDIIRTTLIPESTTNSRAFYEKDLVRCNVNVYNKEYTIMRGTPGVVCTENGRLVAKFDNHCSEYVEGKNKVSTEFNYAVSCHKAQGSEADHVMFVLEDSVCAPLHKRNILYTAMTRAKKTLTIVGPMDVLHYMVANDPEKRCTTIHEHFEST
jgi:hypothetical protein